LWAKMFLAILLAAVVVVFGVMPRVERRIGANIGQILTPVARAMADAIAEEQRRGADQPSAVARVAERFGVGVALVSRAEVSGLDAPRAAALDHGEAVARGDFKSPQGYARLAGSDRVLAFTLPGPAHPFGEGRGIVVGLLLLGGLSL